MSIPRDFKPTCDIGIEIRTLAGSLQSVEITGDIDADTAPRLRTTLHALIDAGQDNLVLDLTAVEYLDSSGMEVLVGVVRRLHERGVRLRLICKKRLQKVFDITGMSRLLDVYETQPQMLSEISV